MLDAILTSFPFLNEALLAGLVLLLMCLGFSLEKYPPEIIAFAGASAVLLLGIVDLSAFSNALSNQAPWTIAAMFVLSGALVRTGFVALLTNYFSNLLKSRPLAVISIGAFFVIILSAFMNNTPVVIVMIPLVIRLAGEMRISASKALIPLSYLAIFGGMMTLIGTSTNLLVDGVARSLGEDGFGLFEITPVALIIAAWGMVYIALFGRHLLPDRRSMAELLVDRKKMSFLTEVAVPHGSTLIGRPVMEVEHFKYEGMRVIDLLRGDESLRREFPDVDLEAGDRVVLRTSVDELLGLKENPALEMVDRLSSRKTNTVEALISPDCHLVGHRLGALRLRRRYGVYPLAVHRRSRNLGRQLDDIVVRVGDTLLLEGAPEDIQRLSNDMRLVDLSETEERSYRRDKANLVLAIWLGMLALTGSGLVPIFYAAILAVALVLLIRAIDIDEALSAVEGQILLLIISMLVVGEAMRNSGAIDAITSAAIPLIEGWPPSLMIWFVFILTSTLTELLSNNAVAVVMTPIAIALSTSLGMDARPFIIAVMIAASCAFATPIGYQTNTMVYGPGGYEFRDFLRVGLPLNISVGVLASLIIPVFFPLATP